MRLTDICDFQGGSQPPKDEWLFVAITPNGPTFIEGNSFPSHAVPQFAAHYPDGIGILPEFRKFIDV